MAEEYQQSQLHRHHEADEEGEKKKFYDESKNTRTSAFVDGDKMNNSVGSVLASIGDEVATMEGQKDRGLVGFEEKKPMMYDNSDYVVGVEGAVKATDRRLFGNFMGKKEEETKNDEAETGFEKANVLEPEEKKVENENKEDKKLRRSGSSSSSSSSDEEEEGEDGEKKKKKKGLKEKIKEMVSGGDDEKEKIENPENHMLEKEVLEAPYEKLAEAAYIEIPTDQANEALNTENAPSTAHTHDPELKEKKGILEKMKEKIPGYNTKAA